MKIRAGYDIAVPMVLMLTTHPSNFEPSGGYLAFIGRISPEKRPDRAIAIARSLGIPLKIAAKVDRVDEAYFREKIVPLIDGVDYNSSAIKQQKLLFG